MIFNYSKYQIMLRADSKKTQGLQIGDIVRRQYFDGKTSYYSLMCVLEHGTKSVINPKTGIAEDRQYFIGALLEGDAPKTEELLDFARITNLFNISRSGAMYLTSNDANSPYMDVIDGIAQNKSLSWPQDIASDYEDSQRQYVPKGTGAWVKEYIPSIEEYNRICHLTRTDKICYDFVGLSQEFYQYVANPDRVIVSYRIKASQTTKCTISLEYGDRSKSDGQEEFNIGTEWEYKLHVITVENSGRHLRSVKLNLEELQTGAEVFISDWNIIEQKSLSDFNGASQMRLGKLDGIVDPVFGRLKGYGGYTPNLFATRSTNVSGTLTAGDENGFGSTFYAGRIHRNAFINSLDIDFVSAVTIDSGDNPSPTGVGKVYSSSTKMEMTAQSSDWLLKHVGDVYTWSFWGRVRKACKLIVQQNGNIISNIAISAENVDQWIRHSVTFEIQGAEQSALKLSVIPSFSTETGAQGENVLLFSSPQLERGSFATQYQATDDSLNYTDEYGAWFNRGGVGGTMQNPLLKLNYDGEGSIGTRNNSLLLKTNGSGHVANGNIKWNEAGDVTFGKNVTLDWDNLGPDTQGNIASKSIKIVGTDTFTLVGDITGAAPLTRPNDIVLTLHEENLHSTSSQRQWYYSDGGDFIPFEGENGSSIIIWPFAPYWGESNQLSVKCQVTNGSEVYVDIITITKHYIVGYTVDITSSKGNSYKGSKCQTTLTANVYYQGKLVDPAHVSKYYKFAWHKYHLPDMEHEVQDWWMEKKDADGNIIQPAIDTSQSTIELNCEIAGQDCYICELGIYDLFPYDFPLIF